MLAPAVSACHPAFSGFWYYVMLTLTRQSEQRGRYNLSASFRRCRKPLTFHHFHYTRILYHLRYLNLCRLLPCPSLSQVLRLINKISDSKDSLRSRLTQDAGSSSDWLITSLIEECHNEAEDSRILLGQVDRLILCFLEISIQGLLKVLTLCKDVTMY